jgi:hypothetical protein
MLPIKIFKMIPPKILDSSVCAPLEDREHDPVCDNAMQCHASHHSNSYATKFLSLSGKAETTEQPWALLHGNLCIISMGWLTK